MKPMYKQDTSIAWQTWQPQHFTDAAEDRAKLPTEPPPPSEPLTDAPIHAQQELEQFRAAIREQAWQEGYTAGKAEGEREGLQLGTQQGEQQTRLAQQQALFPLQQLVQQLTLSFELLEETVSYRLVQLALEMAHQLTGQEVQHDSRMILTQVKQLVAQEALLSGKLTLTLNPQDLTLIEGQLSMLSEHPRWQVVADSRLPQGDCRLIGEDGELESALSNRWQTLCDYAQQGGY